MGVENIWIVEDKYRRKIKKKLPRRRKKRIISTEGIHRRPMNYDNHPITKPLSELNRRDMALG